MTKEIPDKIALEKDEVKKLLEEAEPGVLKNEHDREENTNHDGNSHEKLIDSQSISEAIVENAQNGDDDDDDDEDGLAKYDLDNYEEDGDVTSASALKGLVCFSSNDLDPYLTLRDEEDESDVEDFQIRPDDNLIAIGIVEDESSNIEFYVYNEAEDQFFIHHDIMLPTMPLCLEWMDFEIADSSQHGNYLAVGGMSPAIEVWDVDIVDSVEPAFVLGSTSKKKKKKTLSAPSDKDAVLSLAWNVQVRHVLASGSANSTVSLWDMSKGKIVTSLTHFSEKVQSLKWHPFEPHNLLIGSCDEYLRLSDCRDPDNAVKTWKCDGEIEHVTWNHLNPFYCLASTDKGFVHCFDARNDDAMWTLSAHSNTCSGLALSSQCPGFMVTSSLDQRIKIWDILEHHPSLIHEVKLKLGKLFCLAASPDSPFVVFVGGDNKSHNFKLFDLMEHSLVQKRFQDRDLMMPTVEQAPSQLQSRTADVEMNSSLSAIEAMDLSDSELGLTKMPKTKHKKKRN